MYQVKCTIEGIVPIMFCRFPLPAKPGDTKKKKKQAIEEKLWMDKKGVYIPVDNLRMMLIGNKNRPGAARIYGNEYESKKGPKYVDFCKACVWVVGDNSKVYFKPNRKKWDDTDIRSIILSGKGGGRNTVERPILNTPWSLTFVIQVTDDSVPSDIVKSFYDVAGMRCGLGVYGPVFGRFIVSEWEVKQ